MYPALISNAVLLTFRSISRLYHGPLCAARLYSGASLHNSQLSSQPDRFRKRQIQTLNRLSPCQRVHGTQCYCTKTKEPELRNQVEPTTTQFTPTKTVLSSEVCDNEIAERIDHAEHVIEQVTGIPRNNSDATTSIIDRTNDVEDEPIDRRALIELEVELLRQEAYPVPDTISPIQWDELLSKPSRNARRKQLRFYFLNQMKTEHNKKKREIKREQKEIAAESIDRSLNRYIAEDGHIEYGLWRNSIFLRILDSSVVQFHNGRLMSAMMFGQPLVIDLGFNDNMISKERQNCANQILSTFGANRMHPDPFYLHFCNAKKDSDTVRRLYHSLPIMYDPDFPSAVNEGSYLDTFPKEKLVYLTPHCNEELTKFDHSAVYIIGGIVDLGVSEPLTLAKARREGIQMKKFPLDRYLNWGMGGKSLTINQTFEIMLDLKFTDDWSYSLRHIPKRKLKRFEDNQAEMENYLRKSLKSSKRHSYQNSRNRY